MTMLSSVAGVSGSECSEGQQQLGVLRAHGLSYLWLADAGSSFIVYGKQAGYKWLKVCLSGLCLKQLEV